jgi:phosphopantothenoylcysteine synthetase/decarboxylase
VEFTTHAELKQALELVMRKHTYEAIFMTAAVADYRPTGSYEIVRRQQGTGGEEIWSVRNAHTDKIKSNYEQIAILGERTEKLVDLFRTTWGYKGLLVKFKLEVGIAPEKLIEIGQQSRRASGANYLLANTLEMVEGDRAGAYLLSDQGQEWVPRAELPARMAKLVMGNR